MRALWSKLRKNLADRRGLNDDLREEIEAHLEMEIQENLSSGMTPEAARAEARRRFGNPMLVGERARESWAFTPLESLLRDVLYGLRGIRRSPGFSLVVILTLALGIGANTAIFSVVHSVLLRPVPYPDGERLVWLGESTPKASGISVTWVNYQHWRRDNHTFEDMAAFNSANFTLTGRGEPLLTRAGIVTSSFFRMVGAQPLLGRVLSEAEDVPGGSAAVVLGYRFWIEKLGGDPGAIGTMLALDGKPYQVIGVAPPELQFYPGRPVDYYLPLSLFESATVDRSRHGSNRVARPFEARHHAGGRAGRPGRDHAAPG